MLRVDAYTEDKYNDPVAFDHRLYALGKTKTGINLYRITIEDRFHDPKHTNELWFHNLKHIGKVAENITGRHFGEDQKRDISNSDESVTI